MSNGKKEAFVLRYHVRIMTCKSWQLNAHVRQLNSNFSASTLLFSLFCTFIKLGTLAHCQLYHLVSEVGPSQSDFPHAHLEKKCLHNVTMAPEGFETREQQSANALSCFFGPTCGPLFH